MTHVAHTNRIRPGHIILTFVASVVITGQSTVNGMMNEVTGNAIYTAVTVFVGGLLTTFAVMVVRPRAARAFWSVGELVRSGGLKMWHLLGGVSGAAFVSVQSGLVTATGVALFTVAAVAGQTAGALLLDVTGIGPAGKHPLTSRRVVAALVGVGGVVLAVSGGDMRLSAVGGAVATFVVGAFVSSQPALNGQVAMRSREPLAATAVNFIGGLLLLCAVFTGQQMVSAAAYTAPPLPWENPVVWLGGPFGVFFVLVAAAMARSLGVFVFTLTSVVGQLAGAVVLQYVYPTGGSTITWQLITGLVLTGVAVVLATD